MKIWILVDEKTGATVMPGDKRETFRGDICKVVGGRAPHKAESSGFVTVSFPPHKPGITAEFYAGVIGAKWIQV